jgi:hypothetical protein
MIGGCEGARRHAWRELALAQHLEGGRGAVLQQVTVDVQQALAVVALDDAVLLPDLVEQRRWVDCRCGGDDRVSGRSNGGRRVRNKCAG